MPQVIQKSVNVSELSNLLSFNTRLQSLHPQGRVAPLGALVWKTFDVNLLTMIFFEIQVVTIAKVSKHVLDFRLSLLDILPKYMNPKLMSRSLYALAQKSGRADGHRFLNICHTKAPKGAITKFTTDNIYDNEAGNDWRIRLAKH